MVIITPNSAAIIGAFVSPILFLASCWLTRASWRRSGSALAAGGVFAIANVLWDQVAFRFGWWSYPGFEGTSLIGLIYLFSGLVAGGAAGLLGWRLIRRYGRRGLIVFLILWTLWGVIHDVGGGQLFQSSNLMRFAEGPVPIIADALLYATCGALAQLIIRAVGGAPAADRLARTPNS